MVIHPRENFKNIIKILDIINPFLIIISIIGLFCEYTFLKQWVLTPNKIISVLFVIDFALRLISFNPMSYFLRGYGWVDFLASLPGIFFFLDNTPLFAVFKIIKVGRFFKIIRILRFLRVFSFLKRMKSDSVWIQDRIMKIGVTIVMIFVVGIIFIDNKVITSLTERERQIIDAQYIGTGNDINQLLEIREDIIFYTIDSVIYYRNGDILDDYSVVKGLLASELNTYLVILLEEGIYSPVEGLVLPTDGIIIPQGIIGEYQNSIMLALLTTLLIILTVIIFYMGFIFAKDMQIIQLIVDSFDAGDDLLLQQEAEKYRDENGELNINPDESELISLLKVSTKVTGGADDLLLGLAGLQGNSESDSSEVNSDLSYLIEGLEVKIENNSKLLIEDTVKRLTPAIIKFIKKELKH